MSHRRYTYLVKEDILLLKRRYTSFLKETHRTFAHSGMGGLLLWLLILTACVGEELQKPLLGEGEGYLRLQVAPVSAEITTSPLTKATISTPNKDELTINIKQGDTSVTGFPKKYTELPDPIVLHVGTYTVEAYHGENGEIELSPYFYDSKEITIDPLTASEISLTPSLANAMLVPVVDNDLKKHYSEWTLSVKAGSASQPLASNSMERNLYVKSDLPIEITFSGTNLINGLTSKTAKVTDAAQPRTQYTIQCNPENLPEFTLATTATAEHTLAGGYLNGTEVTLNVSSLTGTPDELITGWEATLKKADGTIVRTYTAKGAPTQGSSQTMNVEGNWPYLPQGTYTLSAKLTLKTDETVEAVETTVIVKAPSFSVSASAYTSYNKYTNKEIDAANQCDGSTIYDMKAVPTIASELLSNSNYTQSAALTLDGASVSAGDIGSQTWKAHTLVASYTFDGATYTGNATYHVTGLPYSFNFYNNETALNNSEWVRYNTKYISKKFVVEEDGNKGYVISPKFYIPLVVNAEYSIQAQYYRAWGTSVSSKSIELRVGITSTNTSVAETYNSHTCSGDNNTGISYGTYSASLTFGSSSCVSFYHNNANVSAQIDYLCLYEFVLKYK